MSSLLDGIVVVGHMEIPVWLSSLDLDCFHFQAPHDIESPQAYSSAAGGEYKGFGDKPCPYCKRISTSEGMHCSPRFCPYRGQTQVYRVPSSPTKHTVFGSYALQLYCMDKGIRFEPTPRHALGTNTLALRLYTQCVCFSEAITCGNHPQFITPLGPMCGGCMGIMRISGSNSSIWGPDAAEVDSEVCYVRLSDEQLDDVMGEEPQPVVKKITYPDVYADGVRSYAEAMVVLLSVCKEEIDILGMSDKADDCRALPSEYAVLPCQRPRPGNVWYAPMSGARDLLDARSVTRSYPQRYKLLLSHLQDFRNQHHAVNLARFIGNQRAASESRQIVVTCFYSRKDAKDAFGANGVMTPVMRTIFRQMNVQVRTFYVEGTSIHATLTCGRSVVFRAGVHFNLSTLLARSYMSRGVSGDTRYIVYCLRRVPIGLLCIPHPLG